MSNSPQSKAPDLDPASLFVIRNLVESDGAADVVRSSEASEVEPSEASQKSSVKKRPLGRGAFPDLSKPESAKAKSRMRSVLKLPNWRPSPGMIGLAVLALLVVLRPLLVLGLILLMVFITLGVFLALGYDGFWQRAMALGRWYAKRRPERAARIHARLDAFAMRWDAVLDRFPEGTVDGLYLPDFGEKAAADLRHDEALDRRFDSLRNSEA